MSLRQVPHEESLEGIALKRTMERDLAFQFKWKELSAMFPHRIASKTHDGSGLSLARLLRWYLGEYTHRFSTLGPDGFPCSFNVLEAFMTFFKDGLPIGLRNEIDHLLPLDRYFAWYRDQGSPQAPLILTDLMKEGVIYSYEMMGGGAGLCVADIHETVISGVSFVRHEHELSCLLLCGERMPGASKELCDLEKITKRPGRQALKPDKDLTISDSYLEGYDGYTKVTLLGRIDLRDGRYDVRSVHVDMGNSFAVFTDDQNVLNEIHDNVKLFEHIDQGLTKYSSSFSILTSLMYLPLFFASTKDDTQNLSVYTELGIKPREKFLNEVVKKLGQANCVMKRDIICIAAEIDDGDVIQSEIEPPPIKFKSEGYWKNINSNELGEGKAGERIFGKTWVRRTDNWTVEKPQSFLVKRISSHPTGTDPGTIYIQRSPSHVKNMYKIGLTRKNVEDRSNQLSSDTGVPLPFGILASWPVGKCGLVEKTVHERLSKYRINPRREFFVVELSTICRTVDEVIRTL
jgi:T5orf172 domain